MKTQYSFRRFAYVQSCVLIAMCILSAKTVYLQHVSNDGQTIPQADKRPIGIDDVITMRGPVYSNDVEISPDGKWVKYMVRGADLTENTPYTTPLGLYVVSTDGKMKEPRKLSVDLRTLKNSIWTQSSDAILLQVEVSGQQDFRLLSLSTGQQKSIFNTQQLGIESKSAGPIRIGGALAFSPDGRQLAFLLTKSTPANSLKPNHAIEITGSELIHPPSRVLSQLWVLDLATSKARLVSGSDYYVQSFDWSPNSRDLVFEGCQGALVHVGAGFGDNLDIFLVDSLNGNVRPLRRDKGIGPRYKPVWSPDGRSIAFFSSEPFLDRDMQYDGHANIAVGIAEVEGQKPIRYIGIDLNRFANLAGISCHWTADSSAIDIPASYNLSSHVFRVRVKDDLTQQLTPQADRLYNSFSYSRDGRLVAFTVEGVGVPPDVYISETGRLSPRRLTNLNPEWSKLTVPTSEIIEWPSQDGKWKVHGLLIKPSNYHAGNRYPLLVFNPGGPAMVRQATNPYLQYALIVLAESGYVILGPNTRGRQGYGIEFNNAIRNERSYTLNAAGDVLAGVDAVVNRGMADPERIGMLGHSYGDSLSLQVLAATNRFKAAIGGGGRLEMLWSMRNEAAVEDWPYWRDEKGLSNPFDAATIARAREQTALEFLDKIRTPLLIETGEFERDRVASHNSLFMGLRYFGVPAEFYLYPRSGHGITEPILQQDAYHRHAAWFDYWLRDKPYTSAEKQKKYDEWKARRVNAGRN